MYAVIGVRLCYRLQRSGIGVCYLKSKYSMASPNSDPVVSISDVGTKQQNTAKQPCLYENYSIFGARFSSYGILTMASRNTHHNIWNTYFWIRYTKTILVTIE